MRYWGLGLLVIALLQLGVAVQVGAEEAKKSSSTSRRVSSVGKQLSTVTPQSVGGEIIKMITQAKAQPSKTPAKTEAPAKLHGSRAASKSGSPVKPGYVPPPPKSGEPQIRQEIQRILDLDKKIKSLQLNRSAQLQRIQEQARIHQKILNELETSKKTNVAAKPLGHEALLAQEKLRIIREETQRNTKTVDELQQKSPEAGGKEMISSENPSAT